MKHVLSKGCLFLLAAALLFACQKNADRQADEDLRDNSEVALKVLLWLAEKRSRYTDGRVEKIDSVRSALDLKALATESYGDNKLVIVPIKKSFLSVNNSDKNPTNYFVAVLANGKITRANLIQFVQSSEQRNLPKNTFAKIFTYQRLECSGQFTVLSVTDGFSYELRFENGWLSAVIEQGKKNASRTENVGRSNGCIDWYLITTVYYSDGSSQTSEEYLYRTCDCDQTAKINGRYFRANSCGGGGGESDGVVYEYAASKTYTWRVDDGSMPYFVMSQEKVKYKKAGGTGDSGYFTDAKHLGSAVMEPTIYGWNELFAQTSHTSDQVKGKVLQQAGDPIPIENETTFNYGDVTQ